MPEKPLKIGIRELAEKAKASGAVDLAQGVIDAPPPEILTHVLHELNLAEISTYTNKRGVPEYREAIKYYLNARGWHVGLPNIMSSAGVMGAIAASLLTEVKQGGKILLPEPFFVYHKLLLEKLGYQISSLTVPINKNINWYQISESMPSHDAILLTSPANPTGQVIPPVELQRLSTLAVKHNCLLLVDEMYREFIWQDNPVDDSSYNNINLKNTIIMRSFSKTFSIPGWRVAFLITDNDRLEQMAVTHDALYIGGSTLAQFTLARAIKNHKQSLDDYVYNLRLSLLNNRDLLVKSFISLGMKPLPVTATYYMMVKHNRASDIAAMEELLNYGAVVTPAHILYSNETSSDYIRIHFAASPAAIQKVYTKIVAKQLQTVPAGI